VYYEKGSDGVDERNESLMSSQSCHTRGLLVHTARSIMHVSFLVIMMWYGSHESACIVIPSAQGIQNLDSNVSIHGERDSKEQ
jgi:hypothetical protein